MNKNLFSEAQRADEKEAIAKLLNGQKDFYENSVLPIVNELTEIFQGADFKCGSSTENKKAVLKINSLSLRLEKSSGKICVALFSTVNAMRNKHDETKYLTFSYKRFEELYEEYGDETTGKIDWEKVKEDKGVKFVKTFPLKDAIRAAKMVASGELEL